MEWLLGLCIWFACGIGSGAIASAKNRSGGGYGCLGFLLGPIGLLIAIGMPPAEAGQKGVSKTTSSQEQERLKEIQDGILKSSRLYKANLITASDYRRKIINFVKEYKAGKFHFPNIEEFYMTILPAKEDGVLTDSDVNKMKTIMFAKKTKERTEQSAPVMINCHWCKESFPKDKANVYEGETLCPICWRQAMDEALRNLKITFD